VVRGSRSYLARLAKLLDFRSQRVPARPRQPYQGTALKALASDFLSTKSTPAGAANPPACGVHSRPLVQRMGLRARIRGYADSSEARTKFRAAAGGLHGRNCNPDAAPRAHAPGLTRTEYPTRIGRSFN